MSSPPEQGHALENNQQLDNAIRALHYKKPVPEIDFTLHTVEDGSQVSTLDRICKGEWISVNGLSELLGRAHAACEVRK